MFLSFSFSSFFNSVGMLFIYIVPYSCVYDTWFFQQQGCQPRTTRSNRTGREHLRNYCTTNSIQLTENFDWSDDAEEYARKHAKNDQKREKDHLRRLTKELRLKESDFETRSLRSSGPICKNRLH